MIISYDHHIFSFKKNILVNPNHVSEQTWQSDFNVFLSEPKAASIHRKSENTNSIKYHLILVVAEYFYASFHNGEYYSIWSTYQIALIKKYEDGSCSIYMIRFAD